MWRRRLCMLIVMLLSLARPSGAIDPRPYQWTLESPSGVVYHLQGEQLEFQPDEDGIWKVGLRVYYAHDGGYVAVDGDTFYWCCVGVFEDGFETGSTVRWDITQGE